MGVIKKVIGQYFTLLEKIRDTLYLLVFISSERKEDPCKSDNSTFYPFRKKNDTLSNLVFKS